VPAFICIDLLISLVLKINDDDDDDDDDNVAMQKPGKRQPKYAIHAARHSGNRLSKKPVFLDFFPDGWEFLVQIFRAYYTFLSTLDNKFLFN